VEPLVIARSALAAVCLPWSMATTALAQGSDRPPGLQLSVGTTAQTDSNLFRLPDGVSPADAGFDTDKRRDSVVAPFAEITGTASGATQLLSVRARASRDYFDRNQRYDASRYDGDALWRGSFTRQFRGEASHALEQRVTSFADFRNPERNVLDASTLRAALAFVPRPDTRLTASATDYRGRNSIDARRSSDYQIGVYRVDLIRSTASSNEVALGASRTHGRYPNREIFGNAPIDNSYEQDVVDLSLLWRPGEATSATFRIGYAERDFDNVPERGFDGTTWLVSLARQLGAKSLLRISSQRDLNAVDDFDRIYSVSQVHRVSLVHSPSTKLSVGLDLSRQQIDFRGDPQNVFTRFFGQRPPRDDRIDEARASLAWTPRERVQLQLSAARSERKSNLESLQYRATTVSLRLQYRAF
jgi:hypothetical protein